MTLPESGLALVMSLLPAPIDELQAKTGIPKSTLYRHLLQLRELGFLDAQNRPVEITNPSGDDVREAVQKTLGIILDALQPLLNVSAKLPEIRYNVERLEATALRLETLYEMQAARIAAPAAHFDNQRASDPFRKDGPGWDINTYLQGADPAPLITKLNTKKKRETWAKNIEAKYPGTFQLEHKGERIFIHSGPNPSDPLVQSLAHDILLKAKAQHDAHI